ncbi:MAG: redoxin family protein [Sphingomonadaceae bacterium]
MRRVLLWTPLALFFLFVGLFLFGLTRAPDTQVRSRLVGAPMPQYALPALPGREKGGGGDEGARLVNIFASWCEPCKLEAPQLEALAERGIPIDAIAIRDRPEDIERFLDRWGDPYRRIMLDDDSRVQMALGSAGVPETFIVDADGMIRHQHIGIIRPEHVGELAGAYEAAK